MRRMRRTKIVCTIGPASSEIGVMLRLIEAGMDVARLNASHGTQADREVRAACLREAERSAGRPVGLMLDVAGPKVRTGVVEGGGTVALDRGSVVRLTSRDLPTTPATIHVDYPDLAGVVAPGGTVYLADGMIKLVATEVSGPDVICRVEAGGSLGSRKGVTIPGADLDLPVLTPKDLADIAHGAQLGVDFVAASFVRSGEDVARVRAAVREAGSGADIIAKIETRQSLSRIEEIVAEADGLMIARGDLGIEAPVERVPIIQKTIIRACNAAGKPVITATEMFESMVRNPRPTRAEVADVANAIMDGTDAVMFSAETAVGSYPVEAVETAARVAEVTEEMLPERPGVPRPASGPPPGSKSVALAVSHATCQAARDLGLVAILTPTQSGATARMVSSFRPMSPILAVTPERSVARKLTLAWGVMPALAPPAQSIDELLDLAIDAALDRKVAGPGDLVAIIAGVKAGVPGTTNLLKIHRI